MEPGSKCKRTFRDDEDVDSRIMPEWTECVMAEQFVEDMGRNGRLTWTGVNGTVAFNIGAAADTSLAGLADLFREQIARKLGGARLRSPNFLNASVTVDCYRATNTAFHRFATGTVAFLGHQIRPPLVILSMLNVDILARGCDNSNLQTITKVTELKVWWCLMGIKDATWKEDVPRQIGLLLEMFPNATKFSSFGLKLNNTMAHKIMETVSSGRRSAITSMQEIGSVQNLCHSRQDAPHRPTSNGGILPLSRVFPHMTDFGIIPLLEFSLELGTTFDDTTMGPMRSLQSLSLSFKLNDLVILKKPVTHARATIHQIFELAPQLALFQIEIDIRLIHQYFSEDKPPDEMEATATTVLDFLSQLFEVAEALEVTCSFGFRLQIWATIYNVTRRDFEMNERSTPISPENMVALLRIAEGIADGAQCVG